MLWPPARHRPDGAPNLRQMFVRGTCKNPGFSSAARLADHGLCPHPQPALRSRHLQSYYEFRWTLPLHQRRSAEQKQSFGGRMYMSRTGVANTAEEIFNLGSEDPQGPTLHV